MVWKVLRTRNQLTIRYLFLDCPLPCRVLFALCRRSDVLLQLRQTFEENIKISKRAGEPWFTRQVFCSIGESRETVETCNRESVTLRRLPKMTRALTSTHDPVFTP